MADLSLPARDSVAAQAEMFDRARIEESLTLAVLVKRNRHLKLSTLKGWASGAVVMPAFAFGELKAAGVPEHLLSLVLSPYALHVGCDDDSETDLDDAADAADELASSVRRARRPDSPGGTAIVHTEKANIIPIARRAKAKLAKVA